MPDFSDYTNMNICEKAEIIKMKGVKIDETFAEMVAKKASGFKSQIEFLKVSNEKLLN